MIAGRLCFRLFAVPSYMARDMSTGYPAGRQSGPSAGPLVRPRYIDTPELRQAACEAEHVAAR